MRRPLVALGLAIVCLLTIGLPVPAASAEPSATPVPSSDTPATADYGWLWTVAGIMTVLLIYLGWRFILGARK